MRVRIALDVVLVTYNRIEKLKKSIQHYENQTVRFRNLIIVNNCSTDGTTDYLKEWVNNNISHKFTPILINTTENLGGSGGFYLGQARALKLCADWVFVADDDAYADFDMVEQFYKYVEEHDVSDVSSVCAAVLNMDRSYCLYHRANWIVKRGIRFDRINSVENDYEQKEFPINYLTYVGAFINSRAMKDVGLVNGDYFIYYDDTEHSVRLSKWGRMICVPSIRILHEAGITTVSANVLASWRDYYGCRNSNHMLLKHFPLCYINNWRSFIQDIFTGKRKFDAKTKLEFIAMINALCGRLGKHDVYKPGWQC